jgi:hypothetical protein
MPTIVLFFLEPTYSLFLRDTLSVKREHAGYMPSKFIKLNYIRTFLKRIKNVLPLQKKSAYKKRFAYKKDLLIKKICVLIYPSY